jgi:hypothetical protein
MLGDKAYLDSEYQPELPVKGPAPDGFETLFSQLVDQFVIRVNYAKTFVGLATRVLSKVTTFTLLQFLNSINNKPLNHIKHTLA